MFDVIDAGCERAFEDRDNTRFHLSRHQAAVAPDHADERNVDARENINRRAEQSLRTDQQQYQRKHDECVGARESKSYDPHRQSSFSKVADRISRSMRVPLKSRPNLSVAPGTARPATLLASASAALNVADLPISCPSRSNLCPDRCDSIQKL